MWPGDVCQPPNSRVESPGRDQGVIVKECAEKYVDHDVDCPDQHVGHGHFSGLSEYVPEKQNIQGKRGGNYRPSRRTQASDTPPEHAHKTPHSHRSTNLHLLVDQAKTDPPGYPREDDRDLEPHGRGPRVEPPDPRT